MTNDEKVSALAAEFMHIPEWPHHWFMAEGTFFRAICRIGDVFLASDLSDTKRAARRSLVERITAHQRRN